LAATGTSSSGLFADGKAIPFLFILLLLALFPFVGALSERFADAALAAGAATGICPLESEGDDDG
jgi:hypothetical protein